MKTRVRKCGMGVLFFLSTAVACGLAQASDQSVTIDRDGLNFSVSGTLYSGSVSGSSNTGYFTSVGMGYGLASHFDLMLRVYSGDMTFPKGPGLPLTGSNAFAGGGIELAYFLDRVSAWSPFVSCGYDLVTAIENKDVAYNLGYRGYGLQAGLGIEYAVSEAFGAAVGFRYYHIRFRDLNGTAPKKAPVFVPFSSNLVSFSLVLRYYP